MIVTNVRVTIASRRGDPGNRLRAYATVVLDDAIALRDIRIIAGRDRLLVEMPSRKATDHCPECGRKNSVDSSYCGRCGVGLADPCDRMPVGPDGAPRHHFDVAHPVTTEARQIIEDAVIEAYREAIRLEAMSCTSRPST